MSFEKKMKKRGNQKLDQFAKNPYHKPKVTTFPTWAKVFIPSFAVAAGVVLFITVGVLPSMANNKNAAITNKDGYSHYEPTELNPTNQGASYTPVDSHPSDAQAEGSQGAMSSTKEPGQIKKWEDKALFEQYPSFSYDNKTYQVRYADYRTNPIDVKYVEYLVSDNISLIGYDERLGEMHQMTASVYNITKINPDVALAIKFTNDENYYAYQNVDYYFSSFEDILNKVSFNTEVVINYIVYTEYDATTRVSTKKQFEVDNQSAMMDYFYTLTGYANLKSDNPSNQNTSEYVSSTQTANHYLSLNVTIPCLNINNAAMTFDSNGFVSVNLFGKFAEFQIENTKYQELENIILNANYKITYVRTDDPNNGTQIIYY